MTNKTNLNYASVTHFQADSSGVVDLSEALPSCKSYAQPDPMAIYWTMKPQEGSDERFWALNIPNGLFCTYEVFQDHLSMDQTKVVQPLVSDEVKKDYMGPGVTREEIRVRVVEYFIERVFHIFFHRMAEWLEHSTCHQVRVHTRR